MKGKSLPKVSIVCLTFNQERYIKDALESFLMQQTDFEFEILINDDASTDGTTKILREYEKKYPNVIKVVYQNDNLYSKGFRNFIPRFLLPISSGEYIAVCEGDDYWTDPKKLQKQVDFMDAHKEYALCFHKTQVKYEKNPEKDFLFPDVEKLQWYTHKELLKTNYIPTNSIMYRKLKDYDNYPFDVSPGDWFMHLYHAKYGKIKFIKEVMSVYRKHEGGVWWNYDVDRDALWVKHGIKHLRMHVELLGLYKDYPRKVKIIQENINTLLESFVTIDTKHKTKLLQDSFKNFPDQGVRFLHQKLAVIRERDDKITEMWEVINGQKDIINDKRKEIEEIKSSKAWKVATTLRRVTRESNIK